MKGSRWDNFKSAIIALLLGVLVAIGLPWVNLTGQIIAGYVTAQFAWILCVALDEIQRQRDDSMRGGRRYR